MNVHSMNWLKVGRALAQLVLLAAAFHEIYMGGYQSAMLCIILLWVIDIKGELDEAHECIHKLGVITAMAGGKDFMDLLKGELAKIEKSRQSPEDVVE